MPPAAAPYRRRRIRVQQRSAAKLAAPLGRWLLVATLLVATIGGMRFAVDEYRAAHRTARHAPVHPTAAVEVTAPAVAPADAPALRPSVTGDATLLPANSGHASALAPVASTLVAQLTASAPAPTATRGVTPYSAPARNVPLAPALAARTAAPERFEAPHTAFAGVAAPVVSSGPATQPGSPIAAPTSSDTPATGASVRAPVHALRLGSTTNVGPIFNAGPTVAWSGGGAPTNGNWSNGSNWVGGNPPSPTGIDDIVFAATPTAATASTVDGYYSIRSLNFQAGAPAYTIGSGDTNARLSFGSSFLDPNGTAYLFDSSANAQTLNVPIVIGSSLGSSWIISNGSLTVNGAISGSALYKSGEGTLVLTGNNSYSRTSLGGGTIDVRSNTALGTSVLEADGGTIANNATNGSGGAVNVVLANPLLFVGGVLNHGNSNASLEFDGPVFLNATSRITASNTNTDTVFGGNFNVYFNGVIANGVISGGGTTVGLTFANSAHDVFVLGGSGSNTYTGLTTVDGATLSLEKGGGATAIAGDLTVQNGGTVHTLGQQLATTTNLTVNSNGTFDATGFYGGSADESIANLNGDASGTVTIGNQYTRTTLTVSAGTMNGLIQDGFVNVAARGTVPADEAAGTGGALHKTSSGTLTLTHNNTYSGGTLVLSGMLLVNNVPNGDNVSGTGSGSVQVYGGATLGGFGTIAGPVTIGAGGEGTAILAPGSVGVGRISMLSTLTMASNAQVAIELGGAAGGTGYDQAFIGSTLTLAGTLNVKLVNGFVPFAGEKFYILDVTTGDSVLGEFANVTNGLYTDAAGDVFAVNYHDTDGATLTTAAVGTSAVLGNDVSLTVISVAVPEPGSFAVAGFGAAALLGCLLRRRSQGTL